MHDNSHIRHRTLISLASFFSRSICQPNLIWSPACLHHPYGEIADMKYAILHILCTIESSCTPYTILPVCFAMLHLALDVEWNSSLPIADHIHGAALYFCMPFSISSCELPAYRALCHLSYGGVNVASNRHCWPYPSKSMRTLAIVDTDNFCPLHVSYSV